MSQGMIKDTTNPEVKVHQKLHTGGGEIPSPEANPWLFGCDGNVISIIPPAGTLVEGIKVNV